MLNQLSLKCLICVCLDIMYRRKHKIHKRKETVCYSKLKIQLIKSVCLQSSGAS